MAAMSLLTPAGVAQCKYLVAGIAALAGLFAAACVTQLPPAPTPPPVAPAVGDVAPVAAGQGRLVIDVIDGPTPVQRVQMLSEAREDEGGRVRYRIFEAPEPLCTASPCVADLPSGNVVLGFPIIGKTGLEVELVHVGSEPTVYRRVLSRYDGSTGATYTPGIVAASIGGAAVTTGVVLLPIGLGEENRGLATAGGITLLAGSAILAIGIWAIRQGAPTFRPGSALHFSLPSP